MISRKLIVALAIAALGLACGGGGGAASNAATSPNSPTVATYVYSDLTRDATARVGFFEFAAKKNIHRVYFQTNNLLDGAPSDLTSFVAEAASRNISVTLLFGRAEWALKANHAAALALANQAASFAANLKAKGQPAPDEIQFDVEPYLLPDWTIDLQGTANQYLDLLEALHGALKGRLALSAAIPVWFDERMVTRGSQTRPLSEWTLDALDGAVLMDYRVRADLILSSAASELDYAGRHGKKLALALDAKCAGEEPNTSFCGLGEAAMRKEMETARASLGKEPGFGEFAVFSYEYWKALNP